MFYLYLSKKIADSHYKIINYPLFKETYIIKITPTKSKLPIIKYLLTLSNFKE